MVSKGTYSEKWTEKRSDLDFDLLKEWSEHYQP